MRVLAFVMIGLVLLSALLIGYSMWAAALNVETLQVSVLPATQARSQFEALKLDGQIEAVQGTVYQDASDLGDASNYEFHVYDATVSNRGFLTAEWVELTAAAGTGDILQETQELPPDIPGFGKGNVRSVVLARAGSAPSTTVTLTYFVFGRPYSLPLTAEWMSQTADTGIEEDYVPQEEAPAAAVQEQTSEPQPVVDLAPIPVEGQPTEQPVVDLAPSQVEGTSAPQVYMPS